MLFVQHVFIEVVVSLIRNIVFTAQLSSSVQKSLEKLMSGL